ncbi:hypothetical protein H2200_013208 [Cladophialophora chaetospira]|uniref:Carbonic anhydrase n=1 Tax=Cladophialophora chaetospira TaxID=386627 RepID=A0AA38WWC1_9EURO|nr:hypothetical protein H2200_013208 [Cladophialophora chaetospira]
MAQTPFSVEDVLERNRNYATTAHKAFPPLAAIFGGDIKANSPKVVIVSCMDPRAVPHDVLALKPMEAFCLTNMSGRIKPALNDIASLDSVFNLEQVVIMHHSNCGSTHGTIDQFRHDLKANCPELSSLELEDVVQHSAIRRDEDRELKADLQLLRECKFIRKELTEGAVALWLDVNTGLAREVNLAAESKV